LVGDEIYNATLAASVVLMYAVKATGTLRVSTEGELEGLDLHEHGMLAYPEYVIHGFEPSPHAMLASESSPAPMMLPETTPARVP